MELLVIIVLLLLLLLITSRENFELEHPHFPHAYYPAYVNDLEVAGPRLLAKEDMNLRVPPHLVDMRNQFLVRNNSNIVFDMTQ
jgi:hypothetical protein